MKSCDMTRCWRVSAAAAAALPSRTASRISRCSAGSRGSRSPRCAGTSTDRQPPSAPFRRSVHQGLNRGPAVNPDVSGKVQRMARVPRQVRAAPASTCTFSEAESDLRGGPDRLSVRWWRGPCCGGISRRLDVLVAVEQVLRVVVGLDPGQPGVLVPVGSAHPVVLELGHRVDVAADARGVGLQCV
jgi:hypothetical protein